MWKVGKPAKPLSGNPLNVNRFEDASVSSNNPLRRPAERSPASSRMIASSFHCDDAVTLLAAVYFPPEGKPQIRVRRYLILYVKVYTFPSPVTSLSAISPRAPAYSPVPPVMASTESPLS